MGGKNAACPLSSAWLFGGGAKAPVALAETGETVLERPGMAPTLSVLGDGLGGRGEATESLAERNRRVICVVRDPQRIRPVPPSPEDEEDDGSDQSKAADDTNYSPDNDARVGPA